MVVVDDERVVVGRARRPEQGDGGEGGHEGERRGAAHGARLYGRPPDVRGPVGGRATGGSADGPLSGVSGPLGVRRAERTAAQRPLKSGPRWCRRPRLGRCTRAAPTSRRAHGLGQGRSRATGAERLGEAGYQAVVAAAVRPLADRDGPRRPRRPLPRGQPGHVRRCCCARWTSSATWRSAELTHPDDVACRPRPAAGPPGRSPGHLPPHAAPGSGRRRRSCGVTCRCAPCSTSTAAPARLIVQIADVTAGRARASRGLSGAAVVVGSAHRPGQPGDTIAQPVGPRPAVADRRWAPWPCSTSTSTGSRRSRRCGARRRARARRARRADRPDRRSVGRGGSMAGGEFVVVVDEAGSTDEVEAMIGGAPPGSGPRRPGRGRRAVADRQRRRGVPARVASTTRRSSSRGGDAAMEQAARIARIAARCGSTARPRGSWSTPIGWATPSAREPPTGS